MDSVTDLPRLPMTSVRPVAVVVWLGGNDGLDVSGILISGFYDFMIYPRGAGLGNQIMLLRCWDVI